MPLRTNLCIFTLILVWSGGFQVSGTTETEFLVKKACTGKKGLCFWETKKEMEMGEMEMDSEINKRMLMMAKKYISYETLKKDAVPCDRPGAPYYNCHGMNKANPYNRGCEMISGCRG